MHLAGRYEEALASYRAFAEANEEADPAGVATARNNACVLLIDLGEHGAALDECLEAVRLRRALGDGVRLARSLNNLGLAQQHLGSFEQASASFLEAVEFNRRHGEAEAEVINRENLGALAAEKGNYGRALAYHATAAALAEHHTGEPWAAEQLRIARVNQGVVLEKLGAFEEALTLYRKVMTEAEELEPRHHAALSVNLGVVYRNLGDPVKAAAAFQEAVRTFETLGDRTGLSNALLNLGLVRHLNLEQPIAAENAYREALELAERSGDRSEAIQDLFYLGRLLLESGRTEEAEVLFERCMAASEESGSAEGRWSALEGLGRIAEQRGDLRGALARFEEAMALIEDVRAALPGPFLRSGYFGDKRPIYAAAVRVLARLDQEEPTNGYRERAFHVVQRAKARALLDTLGPEARPASPLQAAAVVERLRRLGADLLLEYFLGERSLFLWIIDGAGLQMFDLGPPGPILQEVAEVQRALANLGEPEAASLAGLSHGLLGPTSLLSDQSGSVRIAPDGRLHYLPFELLTLPGSPGHRLLDRFAISYLPSASALVVGRGGGSREALTLAGFANPAVPRGSSQTPTTADLLADRYGLSSLPASEGELATIGRQLGGEWKLWIGEEASEAEFRRAVGRGARVVHLATHTVVDERPGRGAAILLAPTPDEDGLLEPREIAGLAYRADLTVLAACRTALGSAEDGRALSSLTGAFLAAGSSAVVATLWDVGDVATAAFMEQFYHQLGRGRAPDEALRRAKQRLRSDPAWSRAALWAGYVLIGESSPVVTRPLVPLWVALLAALVAVAGLALAARLRRGSAELQRLGLQRHRQRHPRGVLEEGERRVEEDLARRPAGDV